jgi:hypothetical protein
MDNLQIKKEDIAVEDMKVVVDVEVSQLRQITRYGKRK